MSNNSQKKTKAKRLGIKSVLLHGDKQLAITAFGKGNDARIAIQTDAAGSNLEQRDEERNITARKIISTGKKRGIDILGTAEGKPLDAIINNPAENCGEDYLQLKGTFEEEFFGKGKTFPTDNVRIQIIHNILDIQKILGIYVNDIIYVIDNLQGDIQHESKLVNILGESLSGGKVKKLLEQIRPYLGFFGKAFAYPAKKEDEDKGTTEAKKTERENHNIGVLRLLGAVRLCTAHFKNSAFLFAPLDGLNEILQKEFKSAYKSDFTTEWSIIEQNYVQKINSINKGFLENSKMNVQILFGLLNAKDETAKRQIAKEYYEFSILKFGKNLGVDMKHLRELAFKKCKGIEDHKHDTYRPKINSLADFLLYHRFNKSAEINDIVTQLRETADDKAKEKIYQFFVGMAVGVLSPRIDNILPKFKDYFKEDKKNKKDKKNIPALSDEWFDGILLTPDATPLTKLLSFLCHFWEGKEINELLSAYIHKFENIQTFIDTLETLEGKGSVTFEDSYGLFNEDDGQRVGKIAKELRVLASIGKMKDEINPAMLYRPACEILGFSKEVSKEFLETNVYDNHPFRNFVSNNVINSRRFLYLVRYTKPATVKKLMSNPHIIHYVLSRIADIKDDHIHGTMIDRYYEILPDAKKVGKTKIEALANFLTGFSFDDVYNEKELLGVDHEKRTAGQSIKIEKMKAQVRLYLTIAYIAVKNLVKTNARYYIAFACFDRDLEMFKRKLNIPKGGWMFDGKYHNYFALTEYLLDKDDQVHYVPDPNLSDAENKKALFKFLDTRARKWHFTKKWNKILRQNITEAKGVSSTGWLLTQCRNHAEHLNVLTKLNQYVAEFTPSKMTSYFQLYHFVLQKILCEDENLTLGDLPEKLNRYHSPSEDFIKIAYVSLAYNLPRYKNLTIEALFDEDSDTGKELQKKWKEKQK